MYNGKLLVKLNLNSADDWHVTDQGLQDDPDVAPEADVGDAGADFEQRDRDFGIGR